MPRGYRSKPLRILDIVKRAEAGTSPKSGLKYDPSKPDWWYWTEDQFTAAVLEIADDAGWDLRFHVRNSHRVVSGSGKGFPDWVLVRTRTGSILYAELKKRGGRVSVEQRRWIDALNGAGQRAFVWWPQDLEKLTRELWE